MRVSFSTNTAAVLKNITPLIILVFPYHIVYVTNIAVSIMWCLFCVSVVAMDNDDLLEY